MQFSPVSLLDPDIFLGTPCSNTLGLCYFINLRGPCTFGMVRQNVSQHGTKRTCFFVTFVRFYVADEELQLIFD